MNTLFELFHTDESMAYHMREVMACADTFVSPVYYDLVRDVYTFNYDLGPVSP